MLDILQPSQVETLSYLIHFRLKESRVLILVFSVFVVITQPPNPAIDIRRVCEPSTVWQKAERGFMTGWSIQQFLDSMVYQITEIQTFESTDRHVKSGDSHKGTTCKCRASLGTLVRL